MAGTPKLDLYQWQAGDAFLREDFNTDFNKLDTAISGKVQMVSGWYKGDASQNLQDNSGEQSGYPTGIYSTGSYRVGSVKKSGVPYYPASSTKNYEYFYFALV